MLMKKTIKLLATTAVALITISTARGAVLFQDDFNYSDGLLTNLSGGTWFYHSGQANDNFFVVSEQAQISQSLGSDVSANLANEPYTAASPVAALYAKFTVMFTTLPSSTGTYFAHFKNAGTGTGFRARVWAATAGAGAGSFRLGIANTATPVEYLPIDLSLNTTYTVVIRYVLATGASTLWIDPANELSTSTTASDAANTGTAMSCIGFRQASGQGVVYADDLVVGTTFADVIPSSSGSNPPFISVQPQGSDISAGTSFTFTNVTGGDEPLSYQWRKDGGAISGATGSTYNIPSTIVGDSGDYTVVITNTSGSITSSIATLNVSAVAVPPSITTQPLSTNVSFGGSATFSVVAEGTEPLSYQWQFYGTNISGTAAFYTVSGAAPDDAGPYTVVITNVAGAVTSSPANLTVTAPAVTNIAFLRSTLDNVNYVPTNTTTLFTAEGIVTTHQNLTAGSVNALFYLQDATAGIGCFWSGGGLTLPPAGALVRITAPLAHFNGLLQFAPNTNNPLHSVTILSSNNPLPAPATLPFGSQNDPVVMEALEGSYVAVSNVFIELTTPTFSGTCFITNEFSETFTLFANASTDVSGQTKPGGPVTILGVLGQFDTSNPRTSSYQLIPSRYADILSESKAATVRFTNYLSNLVRPGQPTPNTFSDGVLRPGETLTMAVNVTDPDGAQVTITPLTGTLPGTASWITGTTTGTNVNATFTFTPAPADAGSNYTIALRTVNTFVTSTNVWNIYVPTAVEQQVFITEFLANPTSDTNQPHFNPLNRPDVPTSSITVLDEYIEIVNQSNSDVDLYDWSIADAVGVRHRFYNGGPSETLSASNAIIVFGGPLNGNTPSLPVPAFPASESSAGLALNNTGTESIILRNGTNIIDRILYFGTSVSSIGSLTRFPTLNSDFVPSAYVGTNTSAGTQYDGGVWTAPATVPTGVTPIAITYGNPVTLNFNTTPGQYYTLWRADAVTDPFTVVNGGIATNAAGTFLINNAPADQQFYFITTP
jgi:hypothetical protein